MRLNLSDHAWKKLREGSRKFALIKYKSRKYVWYNFSLKGFCKGKISVQEDFHRILEIIMKTFKMIKIFFKHFGASVEFFFGLFALFKKNILFHHQHNATNHLVGILILSLSLSP